MSDKKETTPDPEILRHNLQNAMRAVEGLRNRVKTLEDELSVTRGAISFLNDSSAEARERFFKALRTAGEGFTVINCTQKWEPIETAPKDGTLVLLWPDMEVGDFNDGIWSAPDSRHACNPTHWMPLPEGPKEA